MNNYLVKSSLIFSSEDTLTVVDSKGKKVKNEGKFYSLQSYYMAYNFYALNHREILVGTCWQLYRYCQPLFPVDPLFCGSHYAVKSNNLVYDLRNPKFIFWTLHDENNWLSEPDILLHNHNDLRLVYDYGQTKNCLQIHHFVCSQTISSPIINYFLIFYVQNWLQLHVVRTVHAGGYCPASVNASVLAALWLCCTSNVKGEKSNTFTLKGKVSHYYWVGTWKSPFERKGHLSKSGPSNFLLINLTAIFITNLLILFYLYSINLYSF